MQKTLLILCILYVSACVNNAQEKRVAVTFDDLPMTGEMRSLETAREVTKRLLEKTKGIPATGFVNEKRLFFPGEIDARTKLLDAWLNNGHDLGNHTFSHVPINTTSFEDYKADLIRGETVTRMLLERRGRKLRYYRHTQLRTGPTDEYRRKLASFLRNRGYTVAPVTIDNNEYLFANRYREAKAAGDKKYMDRLVSAYVAYMENVTVHFEKLGKEFLGYEVPHILLLHSNELNAEHLEKILKIYQNRGYKFISLDEALKDKAYGLEEVTSRRGLSWIHRWMLAKGQQIKPEPLEPVWVRVPYRPDTSQSR